MTGIKVDTPEGTTLRALLPQAHSQPWCCMAILGQARFVIIRTSSRFLRPCKQILKDPCSELPQLIFLPLSIISLCSSPNLQLRFHSQLSNGLCVRSETGKCSIRTKLHRPTHCPATQHTGTKKLTSSWLCAVELLRSKMTGRGRRS